MKGFLETHYVGALLPIKLFNEFNEVCKRRRWSQALTLRVAIEEFVKNERKAGGDEAECSETAGTVSP